MKQFGLALVGLSVAASACSVESAPVAAQQQAVIHGEDSPSGGAEDATVLLMSASRRGFAGCTGSLIAPNLVLTALHCVAETDQGAVCNEEGKALAGGRVRQVMDADDLYVFTGNKAPEFGNGRPNIASTGKQVFVPDSKVMCNSDIALVVLEKPIADMPIAPVRLDTPVVVGETLTAVGWGVTDTTTSPKTRQRRTGVAITDVGPLTQRRGDGIGAAEFVVGESICSGDSGGPAYSTDSGAVLGVVSRGGNGRQDADDPAAGCVGDNAFNIYTRLGGHRDLILRAFEAAGAEPWLEGQPNPLLAENGEGCSEDKECQGNVCVQGEDGAGSCSQECDDDGACPSGLSCDRGETRWVCLAESNDDGSTTVSTGCHVGGGAGAGDLGGFVAACGVLGALAWVTSRRRG